MKNDLIFQCCVCKGVWIHYHGNIDGNKDSKFTKPENEEELHFMHSLELRAAEIARYNLGPKELGARNIFINHGLCKLCLRESRKKKYREKQRKEGNPDCFAKANNGYCDRFNCCYRQTCIVPTKNFVVWQKSSYQFSFESLFI